MMKQTGEDRLAYASAVPDVDALIEEFGAARTSGATTVELIARAEDVRYNRWPGKSSPPDGRRWQRNSPHEIVRPYDGCSDCDVHLADALCNAEVDALLTAYDMAEVGANSAHVTPLTAAQAAELRAVARWCQRVTDGERPDEVELLAQLMTQLGWAVLHVGWLERTELVKRAVHRAELLAEVAALRGQPAARELDAMLGDAEMEDQAVEALLEIWPDKRRSDLRRWVREWRENVIAEVSERMVTERRPTMRALVQGYNYFVTGAMDRLKRARGHLVVERFSQAELEQVAADNGWNEEFVRAAIETAGRYSEQGGAMQARADASERWDDKTIEIWTTTVLQFDRASRTAGIYCTTFSPHIAPGGGPVGPQHYAKHYLLSYAHGRPPFVQFRREVIGPAFSDSRGVPELVASDQAVIKALTDAAVSRAHLEVDPPLGLVGPGWTKTDRGLPPGARLETLMPGADVKALVPNRGDPRYVELVVQRLAHEARRRFALPDVEDATHPAAWQMRQMRNVKRWLASWAEALWQMVVLCYQELSREELTQILGRPPQLSLEDVLRHRVTLKFDARAMDQEWVQTVMKFVIQLLGIDNAGLMDRGPIIQTALSYIDPALVGSILRSPEGASAALYRRVEQDVGGIMQGNPPPLREADPSAALQLQMAFAVVGKNKKYQHILQTDPEVQRNFEVYLRNLQHNVQETQISPEQGRLGVAESPQRPVGQGNLMEEGGAA